MVVIPAFARPIDTPEQYESRCIRFDAERAAMMREAPAKCCFWLRGTPQYDLWVRTYVKAQAHG